MFKLNKPVKTNSGETVVPFLVNGTDVSVFDRNKQVKVLDLKDFDFKKKQSTKRIDPRNVVVVKGTSVQEPQETIFEPNESGGLGGVYEETPHVESGPTVVTQPEPTAPIIEVEPKTDKEIVFARGSADVDFEPIQTVILSDTFEFTAYGRIRTKPSSKYFGESFKFSYTPTGRITINIKSEYTYKAAEETSTSGDYSYDDLYGEL